MENLECIIYEKNAGIATIRLNRPKVLNAMNRQMWLDIEKSRFAAYDYIGQAPEKIMNWFDSYVRPDAVV